MFVSGLKLWAVYSMSGYCFVNSVDGGFSGDPAIRQQANESLGRIAWSIIYVLFHACQSFSTQVQNSGIHFAIENYFTTPMLFKYLLVEKQFLCRHGAQEYGQTGRRIQMVDGDRRDDPS